MIQSMIPTHYTCTKFNNNNNNNNNNIKKHILKFKLWNLLQCLKQTERTLKSSFVYVVCFDISPTFQYNDVIQK
jgi:hypothetical protein